MPIFGDTMLNESDLRRQHSTYDPVWPDLQEAHDAADAGDYDLAGEMIEQAEALMWLGFDVGGMDDESFDELCRMIARQ